VTEFMEQYVYPNEGLCRRESDARAQPVQRVAAQWGRGAGRRDDQTMGRHRHGVV